MWTAGRWTNSGKKILPKSPGDSGNWRQDHPEVRGLNLIAVNNPQLRKDKRQGHNDHGGTPQPDRTTTTTKTGVAAAEATIPVPLADSEPQSAGRVERPATSRPSVGAVLATTACTKSMCGPKDFLKANSIKHKTSAPFHPSTNGLAERNVRTTKDALKRIIRGDWHQRLAEFLLTQHTTPCTATGKSPAEMRWGRRLTTKLDRLHPDRLLPSAELDIPNRTFKVGDLIWARNYAQGDKWIPGVVTEILGPLSYTIEGEGNRISKRHIDQLRKRNSGCLPVEGDQSIFGGNSTSRFSDNNMPDNVVGERQNNLSPGNQQQQFSQIDWEIPLRSRPATADLQTQTNPQNSNREASESGSREPRSNRDNQPSRQSERSVPSSQSNRYPSRIHRPPKYLKDFVHK
ncbi:uncharacterized protein M6D78_008114 [Vipera latastei]